MSRNQREQAPVSEREHQPLPQEEQSLRVDEAGAEQLVAEAFLREDVEPSPAQEVETERKPMGRSSFELLAHAGPMYESLFKNDFLFQSQENDQEAFLLEEAQKQGKQAEGLNDKERETILARAPEQPFSTNALNAYVERQARKRWHKSAADLSEEQFGAIIDDRETFKNWAADQVAEVFLRRRKQELADWRETYQGREELRQAKEVHPTKESMRAKEREVGGFGRLKGREQYDLEQELKRVIEAAEARIDEDPVVQALDGAITNLEVQQGEKKVSLSDIQPLKIQLDERRKGLRQAMNLEKQRFDLQKRIGEAMGRRKKEFEEFDRLMRQEVEGGLKREMALVSQRWGNVLKRLVQDGKVVIEAGRTGVTELWGEPQKYVSDFLDVELDRVNRAKRPTIFREFSEEAKAFRKERVLNLEAVIRNEDEEKVAMDYLSGVVDRLEQIHRAEKGNYAEEGSLQDRFFAMMDFLQSREKKLTESLSFNRAMVRLEKRFRALKKKPEYFQKAAEGHTLASESFSTRMRVDNRLAEWFLKAIQSDSVALGMVDDLRPILAHESKRRSILHTLVATIKKPASATGEWRMKIGARLFARELLDVIHPILNEQEQGRLRQQLYKFARDLDEKSIIRLSFMKKDFVENPTDALVSLLRKEVPPSEREALAKELGKEILQQASYYRDPDYGLDFAKSAMEYVKKLKAPEIEEAIAAK